MNGYLYLEYKWQSQETKTATTCNPGEKRDTSWNKSSGWEVSK